MNLVQFYLEKGPFWAKKWRSNQNGVLIKSGVLLPRIRYYISLPLLFSVNRYMIVTSCILTAVGSIMILIKKVSFRRPVHPIPIPRKLVSAQSEVNKLQNDQTTDQPQETIEIQSIQSVSNIINVKPINKNQEFRSGNDVTDLPSIGRLIF